MNPAWRSGVSGNPGGRPRVPEELKGIQSYSTEEVRKLISKTGRMDDEEARVANLNACTSRLEKALIKCWGQAVEKGDVNRLEFLLNRSIGKAPLADPMAEVPDRVEMTEEQRLLASAFLRSLKPGAA